ncbi:MAG: hypothetical protein QXX20_05995 [Candidatus Thermoplasmatota archaeon]
MYLITKWFGVFLYQEQQLQKYILFPNDDQELLKRMYCIEQKELLNEEKKLLNTHHSLIIVQEKRLATVGEYDPYNAFFQKITIKPEDFNFSQDHLHRLMMNLTEKKINNQLQSKDLEIIQLVETLDDLIQTANLFSERLAAWSLLKTNDYKHKSFEQLAETVNEEIQQLEKQIQTEMTAIAPNTTKIIGPLIGARLISKAGGLQKLACLPASTIQILGAEKALFRHKKEGGKSPKHGIIFQHQLINTAPKEKRGKRARILANILSTAIKADAFTKRDISHQLLSQLHTKLQ